MGPKAALFYIKNFTLLLTLSYFYKHYKDKLIQLAGLNPLGAILDPRMHVWHPSLEATTEIKVIDVYEAHLAKILLQMSL